MLRLSIPIMSSKKRVGAPSAVPFVWPVFAVLCGLGPAAQAEPASFAPVPMVAPPTAGAALAALTLDELVQRVLEAQPDLKAAALAIEAAQAGVTAARALPNPRIDWQSGNWRPLTAGSAGATTTVTVAQPVENPWLRLSRKAVAESGVELARQQREMLRNEVVSRVRTLAVELEWRQQEAQTQAESLLLLEQVRDRIRRRVELGESPRYDLIKADAEAINARQRSQQAALMVDQVRISLDRLAAGRLPTGWSLRPDSALDLVSLELPAIADQPPEGNPELAALQSQLRQSRAALDQARAGVLPSVDVMVTQGRDPEVRQRALGLSVSVPLLDRRQGPIAQAQTEVQKAQTALDGRRAELVQELRLARKTLEMALSRVRGLSQGAIREAEAAVRVAEAAWRFGERGILDVLDAQRVLRALRVDLIQARYEAQAALIEIERLEGRHAASGR